MSELKRFVLFTDKMIYEFNKHSGLYHYDNQKDVCVHGSQIDLALVEKTSDNILDLVEVGDLVEDKHGLIMQYQGYNFVDIAAIYKRQANGDYKRYEVKE